MEMFKEIASAIAQPSHTLQGKGRAEVGEVSITKKQRYRIQLTRYL